MLGDVTQTSGQTPIEIPAPVDAFATVSIGTWQISVWSQFKSVDTQIYRSPKIAVTPASNSSGKRAIITIITPCYHQLSVLTGWDQTSTKAGCLGPSTNAPAPALNLGLSIPVEPQCWGNQWRRIFIDGFLMIGLQFLVFSTHLDLPRLQQLHFHR